MSDEVFRWVIAGGVSLAALSFFTVGVVAIVLAVKLSQLIEKLHPIMDSVRPIASNVSETVSSLRPKVERISDQAVEISGLVVKEAHRYTELSKDLAERAKVQVARIDVAVDETVDHVQEAGGAVREAVLQPIRQIDGFWAGLRTAVSTYARGGRAVNRVTQDEEMFI